MKPLATGRLVAALIPRGMSVWIVGFALMFLATVPTSGSRLQLRPVTELLQRYASGDSVSEPILPHLRTADAFEAFLRDLKREARRYPAAVAAGFALEAASVAFHETPRQAVRKDLPNALALLEFGCSTLREASRTPSAYELRWQILAADLITSSTRRHSGSAETVFRGYHTIYDLHFEHVRFREQTHYGLALAVARYEQAQFYVWRLTHGFSIVDAAGVVPRAWSDIADRLRRVITSLERLLDDPDLADEARVRSGDALLYLGREKEGLALLADRPFKDRSWDYLRHLVRARALLQRGDTVPAAREYEAALRLDPTSRTANLTLAGLAYLAGQHDEAQRLAKVASASNEPDRWIAYLYPPRHDWPARLTALQKEARGQ